MTARVRAGICACAIALAFGLNAAPSAAGEALRIEDRYSSWNRKRPKRAKTYYIVLHTTESGGRSALEKLRRNGEAHYLVDTDGRVYRIIDKDKVARHAGLSLWEGRSALDNFSIGIEVVGYHDGEFGPAQTAALRELVRQLRSRYRIAAENVIPHSMVAYGKPNRFWDSNHRGRKRCAMVFAQPEMRQLIGLNARPLRDRDVERGRLEVGDPELFSVLFPP